MSLFSNAIFNRIRNKKSAVPEVSPRVAQKIYCQVKTESGNN